MLNSCQLGERLFITTSVVWNFVHCPVVALLRWSMTKGSDLLNQPSVLASLSARILKRTASCEPVISSQIT